MCNGSGWCFLAHNISGIILLGRSSHLLISYPLFRLLKEMGWQEDSENDETCAPLTEDEMREFQVISEQVRGPESYRFILNCLFLMRTTYYIKHFLRNFLLRNLLAITA